MLTALGLFSQDVANVVAGTGTKDVDQALRTLLALGAETIAAVRLLAVADKVDGGIGDREGGQKSEGESLEHIDWLLRLV